MRAAVNDGRRGAFRGVSRRPPHLLHVRGILSVHCGSQLPCGCELAAAADVVEAADVVHVTVGGERDVVPKVVSPSIEG